MGSRGAGTNLGAAKLISFCHIVGFKRDGRSRSSFVCVLADPIFKKTTKITLEIFGSFDPGQLPLNKYAMKKNF